MGRVEASLTAILFLFAVGVGVYASHDGKSVTAIFLFGVSAYILLCLLWGLFRKGHA